MAKVSNNTRALEREIDGLFYGLYGLSEDEHTLLKVGNERNYIAQ
jgi:hypothetical protein